MVRSPVVAALLLLSVACVAPSAEGRLTAMQADGSAPGQKLWWVGELLFEGPAWKPVVEGRALSLREERPECATPRFTGLRLRAVKDTNTAGNDCSEMFVIVRDTDVHDLSACEEDRRIAVKTYGLFNDAVETTTTVGGRPAFRYTMAHGQGSERVAGNVTWVCREHDAYVVGIFGPERGAPAIDALGELLERTARWDPAYVPPQAAPAR